MSITLDTDLDSALEHWVNLVEGLENFNGEHLSSPARTSGSERWRYWRAEFSDGTKTQVAIGLNGNKTSLAINITNAKTSDQVSDWKCFWRQILLNSKD